ncbi:MAG: ASCH domain-containing protein [Planctomycetia bacterium]|nr:ASCH domain-containing protein [Planctomycetia bacterium]
MLLFKKKFLDAIRSGEKTQTIRLWNVCRMKAGQRSYIPGAGYIRIAAIDPVDLQSLADEDARPDGFPTADALRAEIAALYADQLAAGHRAYRIRFVLLSSEEQAAAVAQRRAAKAAKRTSPSPFGRGPG